MDPEQQDAEVVAGDVGAGVEIPTPNEGDDDE